MRLFNAQVYASNFDTHGTYYSRLDDAERAKRDSCENFLESYHYIKSQNMVEKIRRDHIKIFLDSGAFSAFTLGEVIDLGRYCDYIHRNQDIIEFPSVLDSIGDHVGTYWNQTEMERRGIKPLPCFHYGEPTEVLEHYVANYPYITIGGMVPISTPQLIIWLDRIWSEHLVDANGKPKVKVHGFGLTSLPLMFRYPWYSVDSSTWVQWAANGMILIPTETGRQVDVSARSSRRKQRGQHLDTLSEVETQAVEELIRSYGGDPERMRHLNYSRWAWNAWAFPEFAKSKTWETAKFETREQRLF